MKRSQLKRSTPLRQKATLTRTSPLRASAGLKTSQRSAEPPELAESRRVVLARSKGRCELGVVFGCRGKAEHLHHRRLRRHGDHRACNLLHLCLLCHDWIHRNPEESYREGWLVKGHDDPASIRILRGKPR